MKVNRFAASVFVSLVSVVSCASVVAQTTSPIAIASSMTVRCDSSPSGECAFLLYSSECNEGGIKKGHPVLICNHEFVTEFSLKSGESKSLDSLPANVKQCPVLSNVKPKFPDCAR